MTFPFARYHSLTSRWRGGWRRSEDENEDEDEDEDENENEN